MMIEHDYYLFCLQRDLHHALEDAIDDLYESLD